MADRNPPQKRVPATPQQLKAFTHPLRMQMYRLLQDRGQATASMLARETGESSGQTSYHLRQLEKFGFVEEVPAKAKGRERWWSAVSFSYKSHADLSEDASRVLRQWSTDNIASDLRAALDRWPIESSGWREAQTSTSHTQSMTQEELAALTRELLEVLEQHSQRAQVRRHSEDANAPDCVSQDERRVRIYINTVSLSADASSG